MIYENDPCYAIINEFTQSINTRIVYLFSRPLRAAWYQEMAIRYGLCEQPSRPFG